MQLHEARKIIGARSAGWTARQLGEAARARLQIVAGRSSAALWTLALYGQPNEIAQVIISVEWIANEEGVRRRWIGQAPALRRVVELDNSLGEDAVLNALEQNPHATVRTLVNVVLSETAIPLIPIELPAEDAIHAWTKARTAERGYGDRAFDPDAQARLPYPAIDPLVVLEEARKGAEEALRGMVAKFVAGKDEEAPAAGPETAKPPSSGARAVELQRTLDEVRAIVVSHPTTHAEWIVIEAKLSAALETARAELAAL